MDNSITETGYTRAQLAAAVEEAHAALHEATDAFRANDGLRGQDKILCAHEALHRAATVLEAEYAEIKRLRRDAIDTPLARELSRQQRRQEWPLVGYGLWRDRYEMADSAGIACAFWWEAHLCPSVELASQFKASLGAAWAAAKILEVHHKGGSWEAFALPEPASPQRRE